MVLQVSSGRLAVLAVAAAIGRMQSACTIATFQIGSTRVANFLSASMEKSTATSMRQTEPTFWILRATPYFLLFIYLSGRRELTNEAKVGFKRVICRPIVVRVPFERGLGLADISIARRLEKIPIINWMSDLLLLTADHPR
jgi:hypothetical protein